MAIVRKSASRSVTWWVGVGVFALAAGAMYVGRGYGRAGVMPDLTALAIMIISGLHTVSGLMFGVFANDDEWHSDIDRQDYARRRRIYLTVGFAVAVCIWLLGFHITLPIFLFLFVGVTTRKWLIATALGAGIWVFTYFVLSQTMHIVFPASVLQKFLIANGYY